MASTYENDLRLEEMATGENSGSWGTKTNTNLELIADAFSYGTETIADADTTIEIQDGAADAARSLALKITSSEDLTTTRVITLGPNTTSKVWIIENSTSGGQVLTISAGSGSNVTLPNGVTKIIATDGIGAAANVTELYTNLHNITIDGVLSLADGTNSAPSLTNTGDTNTGLYFPAADEVGLTVGGTQRLNVSATGVDVTGALEVTTTALVTGVLTTTAQAVFNGGFDGNAKATINTADGLSSDYALVITNGETTAGQNFGLRVRGGSNASDVAFTVETYDNGVDLFRMYGNGQASFHDGTDALPSITNIGDLNTGMFFPAADTIGFSTGGSEAMTLDSSQRVMIGTTTNIPIVNASLQFEVVGDTNDSGGGGLAVARFGGGSTIALGGSPRSTTTGSYVIVQDDDNLGNIFFSGDDGTDLRSAAARISADVDGTPGANDMPGRLVFYTTADGASSPTERMRIASSGISTFTVRTSVGGPITGVSPDAAFTVQNSGADLGKVTAVFGADENANTLTNNTNKETRVAIPHYAEAEEPPSLFYASSSSSENQLTIGGGTSRMNAMTSIRFRTAANTTTVTGTEAMRIDSGQRVLIGHTSSPTDIWGGQQNRLQVIGNSWANSGVGIHNYNNGTSSANISFSKSRSGTVGTSGTIVANGDRLGHINYVGDDGTDQNSSAASISVIVDGAPGTDDMPGRIVFSTTADGASTATERMRISSNGFVNIGGAREADESLVELNKSGSNTVGEGHIGFAGGADPLFAIRFDNSDFNFRLDRSYGGWAAAPALSVTRSNGNVGIGTDDPQNTLNLSSTNPQIRLDDTDATGYSKVSGSGGDIYLQADEGDTVATSKIVMKVDAVTRLQINNANGVAIGTGGGNSVNSGFFETARPFCVNTLDSSAYVSTKQCFTGQITAGASGAWKDISRVDATNSLSIFVIALDGGASTGSAALRADLVTPYGSGIIGNKITSRTGNISAIDVRYLNSAGTSGLNYVLQVQVTYSGSAPTVRYTVEGMSTGQIYDPN